MKAYLFKHDLPVKKFAADLKISVSYLYQLLRKERKPSLELALRIERYTHGEISVAELLEEKVDHSTVLDGYLNTERSRIEKNLKRLENRLRYLEEKFETLEKLIKRG
ncbi:MAG: helix-turn-helix domain-containing protein [Chlamydiia bacterium]|nr:helix-turn-helix domain-containing protein [Chlamydiia bacterium]